jgi:hypothetical protein
LQLGFAGLCRAHNRPAFFLFKEQELMDFAKTYTLESKTYPGVQVKLGRLGPKLRATLELSLTEPRARERELTMHRDLVSEKLNAVLAKSPKDESGKIVEKDLPAEALQVADELIAVRAELENVQRALIYPAFVKAAVKSFNGEITYEGQPATAELLCEHGPDDLFLEVVRAINSNGYLTVEQVENLSSLPTSAGAVGGTTSSTTAENAESAPASPSSAAA